MKYQHILNGKVLFETNDPGAFFVYLITEPKADSARNTILYNLLEKNGGYVCNMSSEEK